MKRSEELKGKIDSLIAKQKTTMEEAGKDEAGNSKVTPQQISEMKEQGKEVLHLNVQRELALLSERMDDVSSGLVNALPVEGGSGKEEFAQGKSFEDGLREDPMFIRAMVNPNDKRSQLRFATMGRGETISMHSHSDPMAFVNERRARVYGKMNDDGTNMSIVRPFYEEGKTLTTAAGIAPFSYPVAGYTMIPQENPTLLDIMTQVSNNNQLYTFLRQSVNTNSAAVAGEGTSKQEGGMQATYITKKFNVIAEYFNVTDQDLRFVPNAMEIFTAQGILHVRQTTQNQIINGGGNGSGDTAMEGILNCTGGLTQASVGTSTQAAVESLAYAVAKVNSYTYTAANVARANAMVVNPGDLVQMKLTKNTLNDYIWETTDELKGFVGVPYLVETGFIAAGSSIIGDFTEPMIEFGWSQGNGVNVVVGYLANDFGSNKRTIRFEVWGVNAIKQPASFCTVSNGLSAIS